MRQCRTRYLFQLRMTIETYWQTQLGYLIAHYGVIGGDNEVIVSSKHLQDMLSKTLKETKALLAVSPYGESFLSLVYLRILIKVFQSGGKQWVTMWTRSRIFVLLLSVLRKACITKSMHFTFVKSSNGLSVYRWVPVLSVDELQGWCSRRNGRTGCSI